MSDPTSPQNAPTVVLVHGAFADAGSWAAVTERLVAAGVPVRAVVNPLRGVAADAAYVASMINQIPGPVLAVGHSYGGAVITNAATRTPNVVGLVYVAAFAPDEDELLGDIVGRSKDSVLTTALEEYQYPTGNGSETATELQIQAAKFRSVFTADLPQLQSDVYGLSQRPIAAGAFAEKSGPPAWRNLPVWAAVGTEDTAAGSDVVREMAQRAGADITEIRGSHVIMISQPDAVTEVILKARTSLS
ncbi:alpha/beta hydrolase [Streptomyces sp. AcH 505]|uniref:alpha/beta fold hydrolase n=1 Tax=unclassified Streptomyces TaxID=2593676 RepID=UPI0005922B8F|nr:alpha/beta hydrolase [Streptomyces sp. NBC_00370]KIF69394.1 alpha/beta hydrolase [Streptomyces sp. AcH 505]